MISKDPQRGDLKGFAGIDALLSTAGAIPQTDLFQMMDAQWSGGMRLKLDGERRLTIQASIASINAINAQSKERRLPICRIIPRLLRRSG